MRYPNDIERRSLKMNGKLSRRENHEPEIMIPRSTTTMATDWVTKHNDAKRTGVT